MSVVGDGRNGLWKVALEIDNMALARLNGLPLEVNHDPLLLGLALLGGILLDTVDELFTGSRVGDVLDADVDALLDVAVADNLVEDDTERGLGHVVHNARLAVVPLVRHTISMSAGSSRHDSSSASRKSHVAGNTNPC